MRHLAHRLMDLARSTGLEFADVRLRRSAGTSVFIQDGRVDTASSGTSAGAGIRVLVDGTWGFASIESLEMKELERAMGEAEDAARELSRGNERRIELARPGVIDREADDDLPFVPHSASLEEKASTLLELERAGKDSVQAGIIVNSALSYADAVATEVIANSFGTVVSQRFARATCACTMVARDGNTTESWTEKIGDSSGSELFKNLDPEKLSILAAREALSQTKARPAPGGRMRAIFDPSITGLLVHELLGHAAEADLVLRGHSILEGMLGEQIASDLVTIIDDPTLKGAWGSYKYDSEGVPAERVTLVKDGCLTDLLESLETAGRTGRAPNGHGRSEGILARPIPRMANTFLVKGKHDFNEMVSGIDEGILLEHGSSGYAMGERGQFACEADRGWKIKNGKITEPVRHVSVSGDILTVLKSIDRVSSDFELADPGYCGKDGQDVAVDNGGPFVRVDDLLVSGAM